MLADLHLPVRPRGDIALLNGILARAARRGPRRPRRGRAATSTGSTSCSPTSTAGPSSGPPPRAASTPTTLRDAGPHDRHGPSAACSPGRWASTTRCRAPRPSRCSTRSPLLTGNIGRPGASPFSITGQCNAMGTRETGFTASMPGYRAYDDPAARAELAELWGIDEARLPAERGRAYPDIINAVVSGQDQGRCGSSAPTRSCRIPNREVLEHALGALDLLVVQDGFETPTTALADVVLPAAIWGEKDGTFTNSERRVSRVRAAVDAARRGPHRLRHLPRPRRALGLRRRAVRRAGRRPQRRVRGVAAGVGRPPVRLQRHHLGAHRRGRRRAVAVPAEGDDVPLGGTARLYADRRFNRPSGKAQVLAVEPEADPRRAPARVPAAAQHRPHGRALAHPHQDRPDRRSSRGCRPRRGSRCTPPTPTALGVRAGDWVRVLVAAGRGRADPGPGHRRSCGAGEVFIPFHWDERCANRLTDDEFDPISREPNYKQCAVRVERLPTSGGATRRVSRRHDNMPPNTPAPTARR